VGREWDEHKQGKGKGCHSRKSDRDRKLCSGLSASGGGSGEPKNHAKASPINYEGEPTDYMERATKTRTPFLPNALGSPKQEKSRGERYAARGEGDNPK